MTTPPLLPALVGLGWSSKKTPRWSTIRKKHVSGREIVVPLFAYPLYDFELVYDMLDSSNFAFPTLGAYSQQLLMGFFNSLGGMFAPFLFADPVDSYAANLQIGVGDGTTQSFVMLRPVGGYSEPVGWVTSISSVTVAGVNSTTFSLNTPNTLTFSSAPALNAPIAATFNYAFYCRMATDEIEFEQFMRHLHTVQSFKFSSVRTS